MAKIEIKLYEKEDVNGNVYFIGDCDLDVSLKDLTLLVFPNTGKDRPPVALLERKHREYRRKEADNGESWGNR